MFPKDWPGYIRARPRGRLGSLVFQTSGAVAGKRFHDGTDKAWKHTLFSSSTSIVSRMRSSPRELARKKSHSVK